MKQKYQSETTKKGSGTTHDKAVKNVIKFLKENKIDCYTEWYESFILDFNRKNKLRFDYGHSYDIACQKQGAHRFFLIEIDGEKHSKNNQKINDGIAVKYANEVLKQEVFRLDKRECLGDKEDREVYLTRMLWRSIK